MINVHSDLIREELPKIGVDAFAVLMCITAHINKRRTAWPGIERLRKMTGLSKERTYRAIATLVELGHIQRKQMNTKGNFGHTVYRLTTKYLSVFVGVSEFEMQERAEPYAGNPEHGYPEYGNPESGKAEHISIDNTGSIDQYEVLEKGKAPRENSTFHVQVHSLETLSDPPASDPAPPAHFDAPDWMDVARAMYEYSRGEGAPQYRFLTEATRFTGDPRPIFATWAGKASPYQLRNWKKEFPKLGTWFRNEAQRLNNSPAGAASVPAPRIKNPHL